MLIFPLLLLQLLTVPSTYASALDEFVRLESTSLIYGCDVNTAGSGCVLAGKTDDADACEDLCAANKTCTSFTWHAEGQPGSPWDEPGFWDFKCVLRDDGVLNVKSQELHTSGYRLMPTPPPTKKPTRDPKAPQPHIVMILADDLGYYDTQVGGGNPNAPTPTLLKLQEEGMVLDRQYVFRYCSPTRRSFLSGRFPNRITSVQADNANYCSDLLPLAFETLPEKLQKVGYRSHMIGKLHLGYQTVDHLPVNRGFESHVGYLAGSQPYTYGGGKPDPYSGGHDMWLNHAPGTVVVPELSYATNYYARRAVEIVEAHPADDPLFMYLALQVMHEPYTDPPEWQQHDYPDFPGDRTFANMLFSMDETVRNVTDALRRTGMWDNTLVVFMADNGGTGLGNSHPLRGQKHDPWEGGVRAAAFMSGGFVPKKLRNTSSGPKMVHIADWYATFAELAGASSADNVTMKGAVRPIDGVNVWPLLTQKHTPQPRPITPVSETAIIEVVDDATWWKFVNLAGLIAWISYCMDMCALAGLPCIRP